MRMIILQRGMLGGCLLGLLLEEGDQVVSVLALLETTEGHLGTGDVLLGVLEVLELMIISVWKRENVVDKHTRVSSCHVIPLALLASVYEKPSTEPVLRPKRP